MKISNLVCLYLRLFLHHNFSYELLIKDFRKEHLLFFLYFLDFLINCRAQGASLKGLANKEQFIYYNLHETNFFNIPFFFMLSI